MVKAMLGALAILALVAGGLLRIFGAKHFSKRLLVAGVFLALVVPLFEAALAIIGNFAREHWVLLVLGGLLAAAVAVLKVMGTGKGANAERLTLKKRVGDGH